jgi:FtsH-binding integral membrane protein
MHFAVWPILLVVLMGAVVGLWFLIRFLASQDGSQGVGIFTMLVGAFGIIVPLLVLMGNSSPNIQLAVLISGAIIFGCGAIATAIGKKKQ